MIRTLSNIQQNNKYYSVAPQHKNIKKEKVKTSEYLESIQIKRLKIKFKNFIIRKIEKEPQIIDLKLKCKELINGIVNINKEISEVTRKSRREARLEIKKSKATESLEQIIKEIYKKEHPNQSRWRTLPNFKSQAENILLNLPPSEQLVNLKNTKEKKIQEAINLISEIKRLRSELKMEWANNPEIYKKLQVEFKVKETVKVFMQSNT